MKIVMVDNKGNESLVCESIDQFHGLTFVSLMNQNFSTKHKEVKYKLVELNYTMNKREVSEGQLNLFDNEM